MRLSREQLVNAIGAYTDHLYGDGLADAILAAERELIEAEAKDYIKSVLGPHAVDYDIDVIPDGYLAVRTSSGEVHEARSWP